MFVFMSQTTESTNNVRVKDISTSALVQFQIFDFPGNFDFAKSKLTPETIFNRVGVVVFVIDAQDDESYSEAIEYFLQMAVLAVGAASALQMT
jgi:Ras-related GTP-binding protein C/D